MSYAVIIPSYNRPELLKRALASVYEQTSKPERVYLVIDESESPEKYAFLQDYDERLEVSYTGGSAGGAKARNQGLEKVTANYVFFLDDDDEWLPQKIEKQIRLLESRDNCVGVTCWRKVINQQRGTMAVVEVDERELNVKVNLRNIAGSFSFFGFKHNAQTKEIRVDGRLKCAQDMEFYMALKRYGNIAVSEEVLANYYIHPGLRITGSLQKEVNALGLILAKHRSRMDIRDRLWLGGRIHSNMAVLTRSRMRGLYFCCRAILNFTVACKDLKFSRKFLKRAVIQGVIIKSSSI
jgi:glycosyltransferase involved in cell wall biosynthesis